MGIKAKARLTINVLQEGRSSYTHVRYSADGGQTFTAAAPEAVEAAKKVGGLGINLANTLQVPKGYALLWKPNHSKSVELLSPSELPEGAFRGVKVVQPDKWLGIYHYNQRPIQAGRYVMTLWARSDEPNAQLAFGMEKAAVSTAALSTEWKKYSALIHVKGDRDKYVLCLYGKSSGIFYYADVKLEEGEVPTPWTPCAPDAAVGTTPARWRGELVSDHPVASIDPKAYTWVDTKGDKGEPGKDGRDGAKGEQGDRGVGVEEVVSEFATGSYTAPTPEAWSTTLPAWVKGQYLWRRERITYTDGRVKYTPPQRDDTWAKIGELSDQADAATATADAAKKKAEETYTTSVVDNIVTTAEARAILRARAEALRSTTEAERARVEVQYEKVRLYQTLPSDLSAQLVNLFTSFNGAAADLINACTNYLDTKPFVGTETGYQSAVEARLATYIWARDALNAALAESGSFEVGGRNLFGFHKGVQIEILGDCFAAEFAPEIRGVRIRCVKASNYKVSGGVRLRNLGFQRAGYYTASFRVEMHGVASDNIAFDVCDEGYTLFPVVNRGSSVQFTAKVANHVTADTYNGFFDFGVAPEATMNTDCVIELHNLMIERGTIPSPWCKAEEDVEWELANTEYLRTVFDQKGGIEGGLLFGSMLQMRDTDNRVTAYLNGLRSKNRDGFIRPALALGVTNFAQAGESAQTELHFNGSGHIGKLNVREDGELSLKGEGESMMEFSPLPMDIPALLKSTDFTTQLSLTSPTTTAEGKVEFGRSFIMKTVTIGTLKVERDIGVLSGTLKVKVWVRPHFNPNLPLTGDGVYRRNCLVLRQGDICRFELLTDLENGALPREYEIPLYSHNIPKGNYTLDVEFYCDSVQSCTFEVSQVKPVRYVSTNTRRFNAVRSNGFVSYYSPGQYVYIQDGVLHAKSVPDMPGVLVAGTAQGDNGYSSDYWGCKGNFEAKTSREAVGIYRINHYIGHIGYSVMITPIHSGRNLVATILRKEKRYVQFVIREAHTAAQVDANFDFTILGRN